MHKYVWTTVVVLLLAGANSVFAQDTQEERLRKLEAAVQQMQQQLADKDKQITTLSSQLEKLKVQPSTQVRRQTENQALLDSMLGGTGGQPGSTHGNLDLGISNLRLTDISAIINTAVGASDQRNDVLSTLQGGAHDPKERGFSFQQLELSIAGAVDPYFTAEAHAVLLEDGVELEEAYATSSSLPWGLQLKTGYYLTEFGRINPSHPHSWDWVDQPIINSRLFGGDGMRGPGARLAWLSPLPWYSEFIVGMQNADGDRMPSFLGAGHDHGDEHEADDHDHEAGIGGRPMRERDTRGARDLVSSFRWANGVDLSQTVSAKLGLSALFGPNYTGSDADTWIYGADLVLKYHPLNRQRPLLTWQTEVMQRDYEASGYISDDGDVFAQDVLRDRGLYTQILHTINREWSWGVRYEYVTAQGNSYDGHELISHNDDSSRDTRQRISPLIVYHPTEFARIRLQYNYDRAEHLDSDDAHSVWLGLEFLLGSHPAHAY